MTPLLHYDAPNSLPPQERRRPRLSARCASEVVDCHWSVSSSAHLRFDQIGEMSPFLSCVWMGKQRDELRFFPPSLRFGITQGVRAQVLSAALSHDDQPTNVSHTPSRCPSAASLCRGSTPILRALWCRSTKPIHADHVMPSLPKTFLIPYVVRSPREYCRAHTD